MALYRHGSKLVLFVHIPKTGGSSIRSVLLEAGASEALYGGGRLVNGRCAPQHMHAELHRAMVPPGFYDFGFAIVRNPFSRLVSEYWWTTKRLSYQPEFDFWVWRRLWRSRSDPYLGGNHLRPQVEFLGPGITAFRFEDGLSEPIRAALSALELPSSPRIPFEKRSTLAPLVASESTLALIRERYAEDFEQLDYDPYAPPKSIVAAPWDALLPAKNVMRGAWYWGLRNFGGRTTGTLGWSVALAGSTLLS